MGCSGRRRLPGRSGRGSAWRAMLFPIDHPLDEAGCDEPLLSALHLKGPRCPEGHDLPAEQAPEFVLTVSRSWVFELAWAARGSVARCARRPPTTTPPPSAPPSQPTAAPTFSPSSSPRGPTPREPARASSSAPRSLVDDSLVGRLAAAPGGIHRGLVRLTLAQAAVVIEVLGHTAAVGADAPLVHVAGARRATTAAGPLVRDAARGRRRDGSCRGARVKVERWRVPLEGGEVCEALVTPWRGLRGRLRRLGR